MEAIVKARKEANEVRKMARNQDAAAEERRLAAEEGRMVLEICPRGNNKMVIIIFPCS